MVRARMSELHLILRETPLIRYILFWLGCKLIGSA